MYHASSLSPSLFLFHAHSHFLISRAYSCLVKSKYIFMAQRYLLSPFIKTHFSLGFSLQTSEITGNWHILAHTNECVSLLCFFFVCTFSKSLLHNYGNCVINEWNIANAECLYVHKQHMSAGMRERQKKNTAPVKITYSFCSNIFQLYFCQVSAKRFFR